MEKGFHISLIGGSHRQNNKPMQDYSGAVKGDGWSIAVVCDGHGGSPHFRSQVGSRIATATALDKLTEFVTAYPDYASANECFGKKAENLKVSIVNGWLQRVKEDYTKNPFTEEELKKGAPVGKDYSALYSNLIPYGTTLLAVVLAKDYYVALMIGDGVIIRMTPDQPAVEETFEGKKLGDKVESLCHPDAAFKIYAKCVEITEAEKDTAFVICSDGFCESEAFTDRQIMLDWPKRYLSFIAKAGEEVAKDAIADQMNQISDRSSAMDDISIAIAAKDYDAYLIKNPTPAPAENKQEDGSAEDDESGQDVPDSTEAQPTEAQPTEADQADAETQAPEAEQAEEDVQAPEAEQAEEDVQAPEAEQAEEDVQAPEAEQNEEPLTPEATDNAGDQ